ncbi:MAG: hypothetical protein JSU57_02245 [Candidatus Heimdallarchaeota archaeon]|nr:MAG: hypothetical protein JSU57_02245 [Candidatus Heimdallarchaeota archaeon]
MSTVIDLIALGLLGFFEWYAQEILNPRDLVLFFIKQLFMYLLLQLILYILPFLKRIANILWFPFRFLHVYLHVFTAKEIYRDLEKKEEVEEDIDNIYDQHFLRSSLATGLGRFDENAMLIVSLNRIGYTRRVAMAPSRFGWVLFVGYIVITPLALVTPLSHVFLTVAGSALHFYFFVGIFGVMMPTMNDWLFVINTIILNLNIRPFYLFNSVLVLIIFTLDTFWRIEDFLIAVLVGTVAFIIYLWGLLLVALLAHHGKLKRPDVFFIPFKSKKSVFSSAIDTEFHDLDEDYEWED